MHPVIKIICLLTMSALIVGAQPGRVIAASSVLLIILLFAGRQYWVDAWRMLSRLKWFWLSMLVFYGWLIPGNMAFETGFLPSQEGILLGMIRMLVLLDIVIAVILLVRTTPREQLIMAIMWLIRPLDLLKINTQVFAYRLVMTLEIAADLDAIIKKRIDELQPETNMLQGGIDIVAGQLVSIEHLSKSEQTRVIEFPEYIQPQWWQWLYPLILIMILAFL